MAGERESGANARERSRALYSHGMPPTPFFGRVPTIVMALAAAFVLVFAVITLGPPAFEAAIADRFGLAPDRLFGAASEPGAWFWAALPLIGHAFIHASFPHLLFNLLWLIVFGTPIALRFNSPVRFLAFFFACCAAGGLFFSVFHLRDATVLVGASGGITGLLGGLVRFAFHRPLSKPASSNGVLPITDRSVLTWSAVVIAMNASIAIFGAGVGAGDAEIAWQAHVGGYLFGLLAFPLFDPLRD